jgi:hypothetical protein
MLQPEKQGLEVFVDGINNIVEAQQRVAKSYFEDGSIEGAIPPLKAILHVMAYGNYNGKSIDDPEIRKTFTLENMMTSDWYHERLTNKQLGDITQWQKHLKPLRDYQTRWTNLEPQVSEKIKSSIELAEKSIKKFKSADYLKSLEGYIGLDSFVK